MAIVVTFDDVWTDVKRLHAVGTIVLTGNYAAGGEPIDIKAASASARGHRWFANSDPFFVVVQGIAGFVYAYNLATKKLMVFANSAGGANLALTEHTAVAYVAGILADTIKFYAVGKKLV